MCTKSPRYPRRLRLVFGGIRIHKSGSASLVEVLHPGVLIRVHENTRKSALRPPGLCLEFPAQLVQALVALLVIAGSARSDYILPGIGTAIRGGNDMIPRRSAPGTNTLDLVRADVPIPCANVTGRQWK